MATEVRDQVRTFTAAGAIERHDLVALSGTDVVAAGPTDNAIGVAERKVASGEFVGVRLLNGVGTVICVAAGAFSAGDEVYADASGQISNDASDTFVGIALDAATAQGDEVEVLLSGALANNRIKFIEEDFVLGDFTDGGGATGHVDTADAVPAGGLVLGWKFVTGTAFIGDTSATVQVGDASDADRFSALTNGSVFTAGTVGSHGPGGSANMFCAAATTPRVTVTSAADFTSVSAGAGTLKLAYIEL